MRLLAISLVLMFCLVGAASADKIHDAAAKGDLATVKKLVAGKAVLVSAKDKDGATPLHFAAAGGRNAVVEFLVSKKADVNAKRKNGVTPLHVAAAMGRTEVAKCLIENKANVDAKDNNGRTALTLAQDKGHKAIVDLLVPKSAKPEVKPIPPMPPIPDTVQEEPAKESEETEQDNSAQLIELAQNLVAAGTRGDFAAVVAAFDDNMKAQMSEPQLRQTWEAIKGQIGALKQQSGARTGKHEGFDIVLVTCEFEKATLDLQFTFNSEKKVSGFFVVPPRADAPPAAP